MSKLSDKFKNFEKKPKTTIVQEPKVQEPKAPKVVKKPSKKTPKKQVTIHEGKTFSVDRKMNKTQLFNKIVELSAIHLDDLPIEFLRSKVMEFDLMSHRKQLK